MRWLLVLLAAVTFSVGVCACGSSSGSSQSSSASNSGQSTHKRDRDNDNDNNDDDYHTLFFGNPANPQQRATLTALVKNYYAAAAAGNGAAVCSTMLAPFLAESVAESYGHTPGLHGKTCAVVLSKLFKLHRQELAGKTATLKFAGVRVLGNRALTIVSFSTVPEVRLLNERRIDNRWWLLRSLDGFVE